MLLRKSHEDNQRDNADDSEDSKNTAKVSPVIDMWLMEMTHDTNSTNPLRTPRAERASAVAPPGPAERLYGEVNANSAEPIRAPRGGGRVADLCRDWNITRQRCPSLPASPLFAAALTGLGLTGWRRRRKIGMGAT